MLYGEQNKHTIRTRFPLQLVHPTKCDMPFNVGHGLCTVLSDYISASKWAVMNNKTTAELPVFTTAAHPCETDLTEDSKGYDEDLTCA